MAVNTRPGGYLSAKHFEGQRAVDSDYKFHFSHLINRVDRLQLGFSELVSAQNLMLTNCCVVVISQICRCFCFAQLATIFLLFRLVGKYGKSA